jgi:hypothetical protein
MIFGSDLFFANPLETGFVFENAGEMSFLAQGSSRLFVGQPVASAKLNGGIIGRRAVFERTRPDQGIDENLTAPAQR